MNFSNLIRKIARPAGVAASALERHRPNLLNPGRLEADTQAVRAFRDQSDLLFPSHEIQTLQHDAMLRDDVTQAAESFYRHQDPNYDPGVGWGHLPEPPEPNQRRLFAKEVPPYSTEIGADYDAESYGSEPILNSRRLWSQWERPDPAMIAILRALEGLK